MRYGISLPKGLPSGQTTQSRAAKDLAYHQGKHYFSKVSSLDTILEILVYIQFCSCMYMYTPTDNTLLINTCTHFTGTQLSGILGQLSV